MQIVMGFGGLALSGGFEQHYDGVGNTNFGMGNGTVRPQNRLGFLGSESLFDEIQ